MEPSSPVPDPNPSRPDAPAAEAAPAGESSPPPPPRSGASRFIFWTVSVVVMLLLLAIAVPNFVKARTTTCRNACVANLKQIDGATQQWALEHKKRPGDVPTPEDVKAYLKGGVLPSCPGGGTYTLHAVDRDPTCSMRYQDGTGHKLD